MSLYRINDLVFFNEENTKKRENEEVMGRVLRIDRDAKTKEFVLTLCREYSVKDKVVMFEEDIIRKVPLRENRFFAIHSNRNKYFLHGIQGYARRIIRECFDERIPKKIVIARNHKNIEFENGFYSESFSKFDDETYSKFLHSFSSFDGVNVLHFGCGDIRLLLEMFIDRKRFHSLKTLKVIEVDIDQYLKMEAMLDRFVRTLNGNRSGSDPSNHSFFIKKVYAKNDDAVPTKMTIKHKPSNRSMVMYRRVLWNVFNDDLNRKHSKYQIICNWLQFTEKKKMKLFQQILPLQTDRNCIIISVQKLDAKTTKSLRMKKCGKMNVFTTDDTASVQTVHAYSKCKCCS